MLEDLHAIKKPFVNKMERCGLNNQIRLSMVLILRNANGISLVWILICDNYSCLKVLISLLQT